MFSSAHAQMFTDVANENLSVVHRAPIGAALTLITLVTRRH